MDYLKEMTTKPITVKLKFNAGFNSVQRGKNMPLKTSYVQFSLSLGELSDVDSTKIMDYLTLYRLQSICRLFLKIDLKFFSGIKGTIQRDGSGLSYRLIR